VKRHDVVIDYDYDHRRRPQTTGVMAEVRLDGLLLFRTWWPSRLAEGMEAGYPAKWTAELLDGWADQ
jgi:hypothetical protein